MVRQGSTLAAPSGDYSVTRNGSELLPGEPLQQEGARRYRTILQGAIVVDRRGAGHINRVSDNSPVEVRSADRFNVGARSIDHGREPGRAPQLKLALPGIQDL